MKRASRGAVLVETAIAVPLIIIMVLFASQAFIVCYQQLELDGSANAFAHEYALGTDDSVINPAQAASFITTAYLDTTASTFNTATPLGNPAVTIPSGVGFGSSQPNSRSGGVDYIVPTQRMVTTSSQSQMTLMGQPVTSSGVSIEPQYRELCTHFCINPSGGFTAASSVGYFVKNGGDDSSPYYGGFQFMKTCNSEPGYVPSVPGQLENEDGTLYDPSKQSVWNTCPSAIEWRALGHAEHLSSQNYQLQVNGTEQPLTPYNVATYSVFFEQWCHRNIYNRMGLVTFQVYPTIPNSTQIAGFLDSLFGLPIVGRVVPSNTAQGYDPGPAWLIYANGSLAPGSTEPPGWDATGVPTASAGTAAFQSNDNPSYGCSEY